MLIPFSGAQLNSETKRAFNFYLSQLRIRIEMAFGLLVNKWRIFKSPMQQGVEANLNLIVLANYVIDEPMKENDEYEVQAAIQSEFDQYCRECEVNDEDIHGSVQLPNTYFPAKNDARDIIMEVMQEKGIKRPHRNVVRNG